MKQKIEKMLIERFEFLESHNPVYYMFSFKFNPRKFTFWESLGIWIDRNKHHVFYWATMIIGIIIYLLLSILL